MSMNHVIPDILEALARVDPAKQAVVVSVYPPADQIPPADLVQAAAWQVECFQRLEIPSCPRRRKAWLVAEWLPGQQKLLAHHVQRYNKLRRYGASGLDQWEMGYDGSWDGKPLNLLPKLIWWLNADFEWVAEYRARVMVAMMAVSDAEQAIEGQFDPPHFSLA